MKNKICAIIMVVIALFGTLMLTACKGEDPDPNKDIPSMGDQFDW